MSNTTNLNLFKHDNPSTNTNPFNIESALNGNWDKIDTYAGNTNTAITNSENSIEALQQENQRLKETLPTTTGTGETITLNKTAEMEFVVPPLPEGNTVQDGEPTPTVPVEVQVVKGDVEVLVQNKNIANIDYFQKNYTIGTNGLPVSSVGQNRVTNTVPINVRAFNNVVVSFENNTSNTINFIYSLLDAKNNLISRIAGNSSGLSIDTSTAEYLYICFYDNVTLQSISKVQVEPGSATSYTPHQEQTLPLTLGNIELCKIGDYKDYIYKDNSKWYLHKEIEKIVLDGVTNTLNYIKLSNTVDVGTKYINNILTPINNFSDVGKMLSSHFKAYPIDIIINNKLIGVAVRVDKIIVFSFGENENFDTTEKINNWLSTNNITLYYALANSQDIEITDTTLISQLEAINNAISYYEQTNISGTSSGINPLFDVEAYQSTKLLLEDIINSN